MKYGWLAVLIVFLFILIFVFWIYASTRYDDDVIELRVKIGEQNTKIEKLEKEIRLLKTDMHIIENKVSEK